MTVMTTDTDTAALNIDSAIVAWRLAGAHGHSWGAEAVGDYLAARAAATYDAVTPSQIEELMTCDCSPERDGRHAISCRTQGITRPHVRPGYCSEEHGQRWTIVHTTDTGRLHWEVSDGEVTIEVRRPHPQVAAARARLGALERMPPTVDPVDPVDAADDAIGWAVSLARDEVARLERDEALRSGVPVLRVVLPIERVMVPTTTPPEPITIEVLGDYQDRHLWAFGGAVTAAYGRWDLPGRAGVLARAQTPLGELSERWAHMVLLADAEHRLREAQYDIARIARERQHQLQVPA